MKVCILVHSHTGHTLSVAGKLRDRLQSLGHMADIRRVQAVNESTNPKDAVALVSKPDIGGCGAVIFCAPVWGFSLSTVMQACLAQLPRLDGVMAACFVTHALPFSWMGGDRSVRQLKNGLEKLGAAVLYAGVIDWGSKKQGSQTEALTAAAEKLAQNG